MTTDIELEPEIKVLRAKARDAQTDEFITDYDEINDDGDKIEKVTHQKKSGETVTSESNLTALYTAGPATTGTTKLLVLEAEMVAEGYELENPHIPMDTETMEQAKQQIEANGHTPAWEVFE